MMPVRSARFRPKPPPAKRERGDLKLQSRPAFEVFALLNSAGVSKRQIEFRKKQKLFSQGDPASHVFYIQEGNVKVAVTSPEGKEAVIALPGAGDFLGEGCLAGQPLWITTATTMTQGRALIIEKSEMLRLLHADHEFSDRFISYMVTRNLKTEEDLIDQLFNSSEKRLARTLLLLARYKQTKPGVDASTSLSESASRDDRYDAHAGKFFHEQVPEAWIHRIRWRRSEDQ